MKRSVIDMLMRLKKALSLSLNISIYYLADEETAAARPAPRPNHSINQLIIKEVACVV